MRPARRRPIHRHPIDCRAIDCRAMRRPLLAGLGLLLLLLPAACSSASEHADAADKTFLQDMIPHHERAIAVARIGEARAADPRVLAFARRIVAEQTPELHGMRARVSAQHLTIDNAAGARMALHRISDADVAALRALRGTAFDRRFLQLNITSEQGAAAMARVELAHGSDGPSMTIAHGIAGAPGSEIPQLRTLLAKLS